MDERIVGGLKAQGLGTHRKLHRPVSDSTNRQNIQRSLRNRVFLGWVGEAIWRCLRVRAPFSSGAVECEIVAPQAIQLGGAPRALTQEVVS
jgi:hypothetical protein